MKITLRKANAIQASIQEAVRALDTDVRVNLNEYEDVEEQIEEGRKRLFGNTATQEKLIAALFEIRASVSAANAASGIDAVLTNVAHLDRRMGLLNRSISAGSQTARRVLNGRLKKILDAEGDTRYYGAEKVATSLLTEEEIEDCKAQLAALKKAKQSDQDRLLELNVSTTIELSDVARDTLREAGIL